MVWPYAASGSSVGKAFKIFAENLELLRIIHSWHVFSQHQRHLSCLRSQSLVKAPRTKPYGQSVIAQMAMACALRWGIRRVCKLVAAGISHAAKCPSTIPCGAKSQKAV